MNTNKQIIDDNLFARDYSTDLMIVYIALIGKNFVLSIFYLFS